MPDLVIEMEEGSLDGRLICGVDEAGRGPLAGPVVAAAVLFPAGGPPAPLAARIDDSKKLKRAARDALLPEIRAHARVGVGLAEVGEIDRINILQASLLAMTRAVAELGCAPDLALIDGNRAPTLSCATRTVVRGDARSLSIAAASIIAKVERDAIMVRLGREHPGFGWERNAGYPTAEHLDALRRLGPTPHHRRSFAPVSERLALSC